MLSQVDAVSSSNEYKFTINKEFGRKRKRKENLLATLQSVNRNHEHSAWNFYTACIPFVFTIKWEYGRRMFDGCMPRKYQKKAMKNTKDIHPILLPCCCVESGTFSGDMPFVFFANIRRNRWRIRKKRKLYLLYD